MSLVELADEYERMAARDIDSELQDENLSRRQKVAIEDAEGALRMSSIGDMKQSSVTFRHLSMLAQVKTDEEITQNFGPEVSDRLARMRNWINGPHFPDELRIRVLNEPFAGLDSEITSALHAKISQCEWNSKSIGEAISSAFRDSEINTKMGYRTLYQSILGVEKGPRLAPIIAELERSHVLKLLG
jgi:lysyl-tRNA synthetase class 1